MELTTKQISKYVIKSLRECPESWMVDENNQEYQIHNKDLGCSVWIANGSSFIKINRTEDFLRDESLKPSFLNCYIINFLYLKNIKKIPNLKLCSKYLRKILGVLMILMVDYPLHRDNKVGCLHSADFTFSKNFIREERLNKLLSIEK